MKNNRPYFLLLLVIFLALSVQAQVGLEQYYYIEKGGVISPVAIFNYTGRKNLYVEARYNYEEANTFSLYLGKSFSGEGEVSYTVTPLLGTVMGKLNASSWGLNAVVEYRKMYLSTQSQYTASFRERKENFLYAWSELAYEPLPWFSFGLSAQQTYAAATSLVSPGAFVAFSIGKWTFPVYSFNTLHDARYFVLGINFRTAVLHPKK